MDIYVSAHNKGIYRLTLDDNWNLQDTKVVFSLAYGLGLDYYKEHFYCVDASTKILYKLNRDWKTIKKITLVDLDAHGVDCFDDKVVVTNPSGIHMEIFTTDLELIEHISIPLYGKAIHKNIMRHHINSAQRSSTGDIYYTVTYMSDNPDRYHISRRDDGHIVRIEGNQHIPIVSGLYLPHSLQIKNDYLYVCNKKECSVDKYDLNGKFVNRTEPLDGWVRGLCPLNDNVWLVGLNCSRTDTLPITRKTAEILILREQNNNWKVLNQFNLTYPEIFDIVKGG